MYLEKEKYVYKDNNILLFMFMLLLHLLNAIFRKKFYFLFFYIKLEISSRCYIPTIVLDFWVNYKVGLFPFIIFQMGA